MNSKIAKEQTIKSCIPILIKWYTTNKRDLPWRKDLDAYHIWISEIMLQQTRVEAVIDYYNRFIKEVPNLETLAYLKEDKLLKLWQGLGYYNRAKNLQKTARILIEQNKTTLPNDDTELLKLPGIGSYTAGAILSIAYQKPVPAVDGNVLRILARIMGSYDDIADMKTKTKYEQLLKPMMPKEKSGTLNQAMMELGATICIPKGKPHCHLCPVISFCYSCEKKLYSEIPVKTKKTKRKKITKTVFVYCYQDKIAIRRRDEKGLLASLYEFPNIDLSLSYETLISYLEEEHIIYENIEELGNYKHIFTHLEWDMIGYEIELKNKIDDYIWVTKEELETIYSLPSAFIPFLKNER